MRNGFRVAEEQQRIGEAPGYKRWQNTRYLSRAWTRVIQKVDFKWGTKIGSPALIFWNESGAIKIAKFLRSDKAAQFLDQKGGQPY